MSKLLLLPGSFVADYCLPSGGDFGHALTPYFINDNFLASFGIVQGMVIVTRKTSPGETPPEGSFCYVWFERELFFKRVSLGPEGSFYLEDDTARKEFSRDEVEFESVGLYVCSCDLQRLPCVPLPLSVEIGLEIFRQGPGMLRWRTDAEGNHCVSDELHEWVSIFGGDPAMLKGWGWADALHPEDREAYLARWQESLATGKPYLNHGRVYFGGVWLYLGVTANAVRDASGRIVAWEGFLHLESAESRKRA